jgi:hypothetical protein
MEKSGDANVIMANLKRHSHFNGFEIKLKFIGYCPVLCVWVASNTSTKREKIQLKKILHWYVRK